MDKYWARHTWASWAVSYWWMPIRGSSHARKRISKNRIEHGSFPSSLPSPTSPVAALHKRQSPTVAALHKRRYPTVAALHKRRYPILTSR